MVSLALQDASESNKLLPSYVFKHLIRGAEDDPNGPGFRGGCLVASDPAYPVTITMETLANLQDREKFWTNHFIEDVCTSAKYLIDQRKSQDEPVPRPRQTRYTANLLRWDQASGDPIFEVDNGKTP